MGVKPESVDERVNKREYVKGIARRAGVPVRVASLVYEAAIEELIEIVSRGNSLTLTGFGRFYPQEHKGHLVRVGFGKGVSGVTSDVDDYTVLKFTATKAMNQKVTVPRAGAEAEGS